MRRSEPRHMDLPRGKAQVISLTSDTEFRAEDLEAFANSGGRIDPGHYKVYVTGGSLSTDLLARVFIRWSPYAR